MSYLSYKMKRNMHTRSPTKTTEMRSHIKNLTLTMKNQMFFATDPIRLLEFLTPVVNDGETLRPSEEQFFVNFQRFLVKPANMEFQTNFGGASRQCGITCWPEK